MNITPYPHDPWNDLRKRILQIRRECERFAESMDDRFAYLVDGLQERELPDTDVKFQEKIGDEYLANGAKVVEILELPNGGAKVVIDRVDSFKLPPRPATLLRLLIEDRGSSTDKFVPWKSRSYLRERLGREGKPFSDGGLNNLIWQLRSEIVKKSIFPYGFVQVKEAMGARFLLRRKLSLGPSVVEPFNEPAKTP